MKDLESKINQTVTEEELNRLLEVGRLLLSVLTEDEIQLLKSIQIMDFIPIEELVEIGNTGDS